MTRRPFIAGNWKMHTTPVEARDLARALREALAGVESVDVAVFPPFLSVAATIQELAGSNIDVGVQNVYWEPKGAFTGEVSAAMAYTVGCVWTLLGHSERRQFFEETDASVRRKLEACLQIGLKAVVCVGETLLERETGKTFDIIQRQVTVALKELPERAFNDLVIAYEPVWAIGTGKTASPDQAEEVHAFIRRWIASLNGSRAATDVRILYGGSVKADNIASLLEMPNIDGALVGGASLTAEQFVPIVTAAQSPRKPQ